MKHFKVVPKTFILPLEAQALMEDMERDKAQWWIAKPSSSSQGKGIFVTNKYSDVKPILINI